MADQINKFVFCFQAYGQAAVGDLVALELPFYPVLNCQTVEIQYNTIHLALFSINNNQIKLEALYLKK